MENNIKRKIIELCIDGSYRYFQGFDSYDDIDYSYKIWAATDYSNKSSDELNEVLKKITSKPRNKIEGIKIINYELSFTSEEYIDNDFKIKNAINKLSKEEIELLGLEELAFESILKDEYSYSKDEEYPVCEESYDDYDDGDCDHYLSFAKNLANTITHINENNYRMEGVELKSHVKGSNPLKTAILPTIPKKSI